MAWSLIYSRQVERELDDLDAPVRKRILKFLDERLRKLEDPRSVGEALKGPRYGELWKYRVGDYRIIAKIEDRLVQILVIRIGNRREVYR
jgi:mRNA interferase RelE/StbE